MWTKLLSFLLFFFASSTPAIPSISFKPPVYHPIPITLEGIFSTDHTWTATLSAQKVITITAVGDIMFGRQITASHPNSDFSYLYASTIDLLTKADLTLANLETPITSDCKPFTTGMVFCAPGTHLKPLAASGIDLVSLANNHSYDQGEEGFTGTINNLSLSGIRPVLPNVPEFIDVKGIKIAYLGVSFIPGLKQITPSEKQLSVIISSAKLASNLVIVMPHWGTEYTYTPSSQQIRLAHLMIDSGADLVLGSHPHWVQPVEIYHGKLIVYSHGNFIFDQFWSQPTREGTLGNYVFYGDQLIDVSFIPVFISSGGQPQPANSQITSKILQILKSKSRY